MINNKDNLKNAYPEIIDAYWNYEKNLGIKPEDFSPMSNKKVWWKCEIGHSYLQKISSKTSQGQGCPYCSGKQVLVGFNDLESNNPEIAVLWDYEKNDPLTPKEVSKGSSKKVWWKCPDCGESYQMTIYSRITYKGNVCLACSKKKGAKARVKHLIAEGNTLATLEPDLAKEWHPTKNESLTPNDVTRSSSRKVWWLCSKCGNEWQQNINYRAKGEGCPKCARAYQTSEPEQMIFYYVNKYFPDAINSYKNIDLGRQEIDIFIPSISLGIEYDGSRWHKNAERDKKKTIALESKGIDLVRFREKGCAELKDGSYQIDVVYNYNDYYKLDNAIIELFDYINTKYSMDIKPDIDCYRDGAEVTTLMKERITASSFATVRPDLVKEWHPTKNGYLTPYNTAASSNRKRIWWQCSICGNVWQATPSSRYARAEGYGCPECGKRKTAEAAHNRQFKPGINDLATTRPDLLSVWDFDKNGDIKPENVAQFANIKVWWKCEKGHNYQQRIASKTGQNQGCPYCTGAKVLKGFNDLATVNPELVKDWDYDKNTKLKPTSITGKNQRIIFWKCHLCGYEWKDKLEHRAYGRKCPRCKGTGNYQQSLF